MRTTRLFVFIGVNLSALTAHAQQDRAISLPPAITASHEQEAAAWVQSDATAMAAAYAIDAVYRPTGFGDWVGREMIQTSMATHFLRYKYSVLRYQPEEVIPAGDFIFETGKIAVVRRTQTDTADVRQTWRYSFLWKKAADGSWQIYRATNNANSTAQPRPPGAPSLRR